MLSGTTPDDASLTLSTGVEGEWLMGTAVSAASMGCHLRSPPWVCLPASALPALMSHAWSEGMMGTDRVRKVGGSKGAPLSRRVHGTSVHPFLAAK